MSIPISTLQQLFYERYCVLSTTKCLSAIGHQWIEKMKWYGYQEQETSSRHGETWCKQQSTLIIKEKGKERIISYHIWNVGLNIYSGLCLLSTAKWLIAIGHELVAKNEMMWLATTGCMVAYQPSFLLLVFSASTKNSFILILKLFSFIMILYIKICE